MLSPSYVSCDKGVTRSGGWTSLEFKYSAQYLGSDTHYRQCATYNRKYDMKKYVKSQVCHLKSQVCYVQILESQVCFNYRKYGLQYRKYGVVNHVISQV